MHSHSGIVSASNIESATPLVSPDNNMNVVGVDANAYGPARCVADAENCLVANTPFFAAITLDS